MFLGKKNGKLTYILLYKSIRFEHVIEKSSLMMEDEFRGFYLFSDLQQGHYAYKKMTSGIFMIGLRCPKKPNSNCRLTQMFKAKPSFILNFKQETMELAKSNQNGVGIPSDIPDGVLSLKVNGKVHFKIDCFLKFSPFTKNHMSYSQSNPIIIWADRSPQELTISPSEYTSNASPSSFTTFSEESQFKITEKIIEPNKIDLVGELRDFLEDEQGKVQSYYQIDEDTLGIHLRKGLIRCQ